MQETLTAIFRAVDQISPVVNNMDANLKKVEANVSGLANKFSTAYKIIGGTAAFAAVVQGIRTVVDAADEIDTFMGRIDDTAEHVQTLQAVAIQFDTEMGSIVSAIQTMQQRLGDGKLDDALRRINLNVDDFKRLAPAQQYLSVAEALGRIKDPAERATLAKELLGNASKAVAATFRENVTQVDAWYKASNASVEASDLLSSAWEKSKQAAKNFGIELFTLVSGFRAYVELRQQYEKWFTVGELPGVNVSAAARAALPEGLKPLGMDEAELKRVEDALTKTAEVAIKKNQEIVKASKEAEEAQKRWHESTHNFSRFMMAEYAPSLHDSQEAIRNITAGLTSEGNLHSGTIGAFIEAQKEAEEWARVNGAVLAPSIKAISTELAQSTEKTTGWASAIKTSLMGVLGSIPQTIANAFTGGGDIGGAIKSIVSQAGAASGGAVGSMAGPLGQQIGQAIGSMAGMLVDPIKKLFGIGINEEVRKWNAEIEKLRQSLLASHGDLDKLEAAANRVGLSFKANWGHQNLAGFNAFKDLLAEFEDRTERLTTATEKYGLTWRDLGEDAQRSHIVELSRELAGEWELLVQAGYRVERVAEQMAGAVNEFLSDAIRTGAEVDVSMRPMLERMLEMGLLTDETGEKLDDLSRIRWAETLTQGFDRVVDAIRDMTDVLERHVPFSADYAARSLEDMASRGIAAAETLGAAISEEVIQMHSPTGLEGIAYYAGLAGKELEKMARVGVSEIDDLAASVSGVSGGLDGVLSKMREFRRGVPLETIRVGRDEEPGPFEGFVSPHIELITEAQAIARAHQVAGLYGVTLQDSDLGRLAELYGYGGTGQLSKARFEDFLKDLGRNIVEGRVATLGLSEGTIGGGSWFRDFGRGTPAVLHGREAVVREDQAGAFATAHGGADVVAELRELRADLPRAIGVAIDDVMAKRRRAA